MPLTPKESLNKAYKRQKVNRAEIETFRSNLALLLKDLNERESEEHLKNNVMTFLSDTWYKNDHFINTKGKTDFVIHQEKSPKSKVGVLTEVKRPGNKGEMISKEQLNTKALQELLLYYLREHKNDKDADIKYLVVTNIYEWFIFDAAQFHKYFFKNKKLQKAFQEWDSKQLEGTDTTFFYTKIASTYIAEVEDQLEYTWFDLREYEKELRKGEDSQKLISLFKVLSPVHLLKKPFANDSNSLNKQFYHELLHIIGLEEVKDKGKKVIQRKAEGKRIEGSFLENAIITMDERDRLNGLDRPSHFGDTHEERLYAVALELCITWINRILFLKLMESQLVTYHKKDQAYRFLDINTVPNYDALESLFFGVLAKRIEDRSDRYKEKYSKVPYLNSSLFEPTGLEEVMTVTMLNNNLEHELYSRTVLKDANGKPLSGKMDTLEYLFRFLEAYDFSSEGKEEIQENNKSLINASVLGLIFEKINGYKDGSFYTPGFITMYMCRETIRRAVVQKFNEAKGWKLESFDQLYDHIEKDKKQEANDIINSLKICDPAVGSGHFLVSALNEIIAIKSELKILLDREGKTLRDYEVTIENDELIVESEGDPFQYAIGNKEKQRVQETLFHEKQTIIENCLFGVDINANSVKICRLRLWIELLKNAYYKNEAELETLPNIDINIKTGNSLISRFDLDADLTKVLKSIKYSISEYRGFVNDYKNATDKEAKRGFEQLIKQIKADFRTEIANYSDSDKNRLKKLEHKMFQKYQSGQLYDLKLNEKQKKDRKKLEDQINKLSEKVRNKVSDPIYEDAFEWRFEFPEVLDDQGNFIGFDVVIGNPPYVYRNYNFDNQKKYYKEQYHSYEGNFDLYKFFLEKVNSLINEGGLSTLIVPNTFLSANTYLKSRTYLIRHFNFIELFDLGLDVFEGVTVENIIFQGRKEENPINEDVLIKIDRRKEKSIRNPLKQYSLSLSDIFREEQNFNIYFEKNTKNLIDKIRQKTVPLDSLAYCTVGINTGYIKDQLTAKSRIDNSYHKMLNGKDIGYYSLEWKGEWIKYDKEFVNSFGDKGRTLPPKYIFEDEKILVQRTRRGLKRKLVCTLDSEKYYNLNRISNIVLKDKSQSIRYLLALLNSALLDFYFNNVFNEYEVKPIHLNQLPIKVNSKNEKRLAQIVDKILSTKKEDSDKDTSEYETEIDLLVYELYGLTEDEIKIVEGGAD